MIYTLLSDDLYPALRWQYPLGDEDNASNSLHMEDESLHQRQNLLFHVTVTYATVRSVSLKVKDSSSVETRHEDIARDEDITTGFE